MTDRGLCGLLPCPPTRVYWSEEYDIDFGWVGEAVHYEFRGYESALEILRWGRRSRRYE